jgi:mannose-6-phosphate isomerase-like protein (cupin superfamily)
VGRLEVTRIPEQPDATAPDGSEVRVLLGLPGGGMAHFQLAPGEVTIAVRHRTVEEIWFVAGGAGQIWRRLDDEERTDDLAPGVCLTIPLGTTFQFRSLGPLPLQVLGVTMPPWPGPDEAILTEGPWEADVTSAQARSRPQSVPAARLHEGPRFTTRHDAS